MGKPQDAMRVFFLEGYAAGVEAQRAAYRKVLENTATVDERETFGGFSDDVARAITAKNAPALAAARAKLKPEGK